ncbi:hypothetical protein [Chitinophaga nivalis]|uniref:Uncharacterized protein n=1 Tax=Chitinophaga nivalis TaxID=2991709 RepID=A0ABT3IPD0_9BACT|nr:hypothetical protein [Chitinophaga nivalis]MCW3464506.1 hypothetical protein [Chitinophaga nivalis]MCW3485803.1 hypothetical protein [Chitinophaga nivalis]
MPPCRQVSYSIRTRQDVDSYIRHYHPSLRMKKAVYLIKDRQLYTPEAGYQPGFTNPCHFTGFFARHVRPPYHDGLTVGLFLYP